MLEPYSFNDSSNAVSQITSIDDVDTTSELAALREARKRAFDARIAAERALRQAEEAEAGLLAQEELAVASATAARREQAVEIARVAAGREREILERVTRIEAQLQQSARARDQAQIAASSVAQSRDEAQRALDRLDASLAGFREQLRTAEVNERNLESELGLMQEQAAEATLARQQAEAFISAIGTPMTLVPAAALTIAAPVADRAPASVPAEPALSRPAPVSDLIAIAAQRAAERRAADAARAQERS